MRRIRGRNRQARRAMSKQARSAQSNKIGELVREGYPQKQAVAISFSELRKGGVKRLKRSHGAKGGAIRRRAA